MSPRLPRLAAALAALASAAVVSSSAAAASPVRLSAEPIATPLSAKAVRTTITVSNAGRRRVSGLTLSIAAPRGVAVRVAGAKRGRPQRRLKALAPGKAVRVVVAVRRAGRAAPRRGHLAVKVARGGRALARARIAFGRAGRAAPTDPAPTPEPEPQPQPQPRTDPNSLAGRYFWGSLYTIGGIDQRSLYFTGPDLVSTAAAESAFPACTAPNETCKPYSYDAATGSLTIDGMATTLQGRKIELDGRSYLELGYPPAGARWDAYVTYSNSSGICPLYCSYYTENLAFLADGTFVRDAVASGSGPVVDWASVPPDRKGTYEIRADHTLRLAYADGRERIETVGLYLDDAGSPKPPGEGVILGGDGYFDIRD